MIETKSPNPTTRQPHTSQPHSQPNHQPNPTATPTTNPPPLHLPACLPLGLGGGLFLTVVFGWAAGVFGRIRRGPKSPAFSVQIASLKTHVFSRLKRVFTSLFY